jgi:hypothetical protein
VDVKEREELLDKTIELEEAELKARHLREEGSSEAVLYRRVREGGGKRRGEVGMRRGRWKGRKGKCKEKEMGRTYGMHQSDENAEGFFVWHLTQGNQTSISSSSLFETTQTPEQPGLWRTTYIQQQRSHNERRALNIPHLRVIQAIRPNHVIQLVLTSPSLLYRR